MFVDDIINKFWERSNLIYGIPKGRKFRLDGITGEGEEWCRVSARCWYSILYFDSVLYVFEQHFLVGWLCTRRVRRLTSDFTKYGGSKASGFFSI